MPRGWLKRAAALVPSSLPRLAEPAIVVTCPAAVTFRIVSFSVSATKTLPPPSTARLSGRLKRAALPVPSPSPTRFAEPASVVTNPAGVIFRIV